MSEFDYEVGDEPAIRRASSDDGIAGFLCPFCGTEQMKLGWRDLPQDTQRVGVYCDNHLCQARDMEFVTTRGEGAHRRADVTALKYVDAGTDEEQLAEGTVVERDEDGHVESRVSSYREHSVKRSEGEREVARLERRLRPTTVVIRPRPNDD